MSLTGAQPEDGDNLLLLVKKGKKLAFKLHFVLEQWDLHPISATTAEASSADLDALY